MVKVNKSSIGSQEILKILTNEDSTESEYLELINCHSSDLLQIIHNSSKISEKAIVDLFRLSNNVELTFATFNHENFPSEIVENYARSSTVADRKIAAQNPRLSIEALCKLAEDENWDVRHEVLFNESMPKALANLYIDEIY